MVEIFSSILLIFLVDFWFPFSKKFLSKEVEMFLKGLQLFEPLFYHAQEVIDKGKFVPFPATAAQLGGRFAIFLTDNR